MRPRCVLRAFVMTTAILAGGLLPAGAARAGGVVDILAPAFGNGCTNHYRHSTARSSLDANPGDASGNTVAVTLTSPLNQCGGADMPLEIPLEIPSGDPCVADVIITVPLCPHRG